MAERFTAQSGGGGFSGDEETSEDDQTQDQDQDSDQSMSAATASRDEGITTSGPGGSDTVQPPDSDGGSGGGTSSRDEGITTPSPGGSDTVQPPDSGDANGDQNGGGDTTDPGGGDPSDPTAPTDPSPTDPEDPGDGSGDTPTDSTDPSNGGPGGGPPPQDGGFVTDDGDPLPTPEPDPTDGTTGGGTDESNGGAQDGADPTDGDATTDGDGGDSSTTASDVFDISGGSSEVTDSWQHDVAEDRPGEIGAQARSLEQEIVSENPFVDETDVRIVEEERNGQAYLVPEFTEDYREEAARRDARAYAINTSEAGPEDIEDVEVTDGSAQVEFTDEFQQERVATEIEGVTADDIEAVSFDDGDAQIEYSDSFRAEQTQEQLAAELPYVEADDVEVDASDGEMQANLREIGQLSLQGLDESRLNIETGGQAAEQLEADLGVDLDADESVAYRYRGAPDADARGPSIEQMGSEYRAEGELVDPGTELETYLYQRRVQAQEERQEAREELSERAEERFGETLEEGEGYEIVEDDDRIRLRVTPEGQGRLAEERVESSIAARFDLAEDNVHVSAERRDERELLLARRHARESDTVDTVQEFEFDVSRGTREQLIERTVADSNDDLRMSDVNAYRNEETGEFGVNIDQDEQFGDFGIPIPGSGTTVEGVARGYSTLYSENIAQPVSEATGDATVMTQRALAFSNPVTARGAPAQGEDTAFSGVTEASARTLAEIVNPGSMAVTVNEAYEYSAYAGEEISQGRTGELVDQTAGATQDVVDAGVESFRENPVETTAVAGITLGATAALMGGAARVGSRAGAATRYAIQPGEELASAGLTRAFPGIARRFPNNRIDNEEIILRGGDRVRAGVSARARRVRDFVRGDRELSATPRQQDLVDRFRPGARGQTFDTETPGEVTQETGSAGGAQSEPLGSGTENILDTTIGTRTEVGAEGSSQPTRPSGNTESGRNELPLRDEIDEAGGVRPFLRDEDLPQRVPQSAMEQRDIRSLMSDERGQASLLGRSRSRTESSESDFSSDLERPGELQSEIQQMSLRQRRRLSGGYERRSDPIESGVRRRRERAQRRETTVESERPADTRRRLSYRSEIDMGPAERILDSPLERLSESQASEITPEIGVGSELGMGSSERERERVDTEPEVGVEPDIDTEVGIRSGQEVAQEVESRAGLELEAEQEARVEPRFEFEMEQETESEFEFETETETETEIERELFDLPELGGGSTAQRSVGIGGAGEQLTDFIDPLTGEVLETESLGDEEPESPGGFL